MYEILTENTRVQTVKLSNETCGNRKGISSGLHVPMKEENTTRRPLLKTIQYVLVQAFRHTFSGVMVRSEKAGKKTN